MSQTALALSWYFMFAAGANGFNYFVLPCIALSVVLMVVSVFLPDEISGEG